MAKQDNRPMDPADLRQKAKALARERNVRTPEDSGAPSPEEIHKTLHELQVYQIELEMQNEELRAAQVLIEAGRERYYDLYDLAPVGYCTLSENGLILEANLTAATLLGTTRSLLVKQPITRFIFKQDQDIHFLHRKKLFDAGEVQEYDLRLLKPDGAFFWAHLKATAALAEGGAPVCRVVLVDITKRKQAEEALRESEALLSRSEEIAHTGSWKLDLTANRLTWSDEVYHIFGCKPQEFAPTYEAFLDFVHPEDRTAVDEAYSRSQREGSNDYEIEHRIVRRNSDEVRHVHERCVHERDAAGTVIQSTGMVQDITERKQAETYREMWREILQCINESGGQQEFTQRVLTVLKTQSGVDAVGLRLQEGDDFPYFAQDGFPADFLQTENTLVERNKEGGLCRDKDGNVHLECACGLVISGKTDPTHPLFTKGGSCWTNDSLPILELPSDQDPRLHPRNNCIHQGYASVALIPVRTSDRIVGLIQLNDKHKDRFTLETIEILEGIAAHIGSALMRKRAEVEQEKLQAQLSQAQKMEAIGIMAGGIAHDFNNLLAIVSSNIEAIQIKHQRKSPFEKNVENIITAGSRAKNLIAQILAFSRQEKTDLKPVDLSATIDESLKLLRSTLPKTIEIMNLLPNRPIFIDADSTLMQQVLFNLCNNATYAMKGKGLLKIALNEVNISSLDLPVSSKVPTGIYAKLSISDTGSGIDKDTINKIFDPFFTTKGVGIGTGMGLSVVHGIVEQHGGFITVDSSPGGGTTFELYFPASANIYTELKRSQTEPLPTGTERILFVDDEECIVYTCNELLEFQGYKVTSVTSGNEALDLFKANPDDFDLVFTDQTMPAMSGAELATELLKIRPDIPIILCSGYSATVSEEDAKGIGIREFCMKPMDKKQLATVVRKVLDESGEAVDK